MLEGIVGTTPDCRNAPLQSRWERRHVKPQKDYRLQLAALWAVEMLRMLSVIGGG